MGAVSPILVSTCIHRCRECSYFYNFFRSCSEAIASPLDGPRRPSWVVQGNWGKGSDVAIRLVLFEVRDGPDCPEALFDPKLSRG